MRLPVLGLCLALIAIATAPVRADDRSLKAETDLLQQAAASLARTMADATKGSTIGIGPTGTWLLGAYLRKGQTAGASIAVKKGMRYALCAATAGEGRSLVVQARGADSKVLADDRGPNPFVIVTAEADGVLKALFAPRESATVAPCLMAILKEGGAPVVADEIVGLVRNLATRIRVVGGGPRNGSLDHGSDDWSITGSIMDKQAITIVEDLQYGTGTVHAVAVGQSTARNIDLAFLSANRKALQSDTAPDAVPHVTLKTTAGTKYGVFLNLEDGPPRSLVLAAVMREGGPAAAPAEGAKEGLAGAKETDAPKPPATSALGDAPHVPDHLFGMPEEVTVAYGAWQMRRVKDSVCMTSADGTFAVEWWEGSNGYVVMLENGSTYNWMAVGARLSGKFDIPPTSVWAFKAEKRLTERSGECRRWRFQFTPEGIQISNTQTEATYLVVKARAELVHTRAGVRTTLPAKQP